MLSTRPHRSLEGFTWTHPASVSDWLLSHPYSVCYSSRYARQALKNEAASCSTILSQYFGLRWRRSSRSQRTIQRTLRLYSATFRSIALGDAKLLGDSAMQRSRTKSPVQSASRVSFGAYHATRQVLVHCPIYKEASPLAALC